MESFFASLLSVCLAEIGDKTQLLTLFLVARLNQKYAIMAGIVFSTAINHLLSAWLGNFFNQWIDPQLMNLITGIALIAVGLWILIPDKDDESSKLLSYGAFITTLILFFLAEIGDKTQIATVLLAAKYHSILIVSLGSVLGVLLANIPVIYLGEKILKNLPVKTIRIAACVVFCVIGAWTVISQMI